MMYTIFNRDAKIGELSFFNKKWKEVIIAREMKSAALEWVLGEEKKGEEKKDLPALKGG